MAIVEGRYGRKGIKSCWHCAGTYGRWDALSLCGYWYAWLYIWSAVMIGRMGRAMGFVVHMFGVIV
jgi:hypothetical protein